MTDIPPEVRDRLAKDLRILRKMERGFMMTNQPMNIRRDRPAFMYINHLQGLAATFEYVRNLPTPLLVDLGSGTSRGIAELARSNYGDSISFLSTGLLFDPAIDKHLGHSRYRVTPAEIMRGFPPESVGGFLSVYGPFEYSRFLPLVFAKVDELLIPGGVVKLCVMAHVPSNPKMHIPHQQTCANVENEFRARGFGFTAHDYDIIHPPSGVYHHSLPCSNRIFVGVKQNSESSISAEQIAQRLMQADLEMLPEMKIVFPEIF